MSRFYASISGSAKTEATRQGTERSGISGHVRGWDLGIRVVGSVDDQGRNTFLIYKTGGSNGHVTETLLAEVRQSDIVGGGEVELFNVPRDTTVFGV